MDNVEYLLPFGVYFWKPSPGVCRGLILSSACRKRREGCRQKLENWEVSLGALPLNAYLESESCLMSLSLSCLCMQVLEHAANIFPSLGPFFLVIIGNL